MDYSNLAYTFTLVNSIKRNQGEIDTLILELSRVGVKIHYMKSFYATMIALSFSPVFERVIIFTSKLKTKTANARKVNEEKTKMQ